MRDNRVLPLMASAPDFRCPGSRSQPGWSLALLGVAATAAPLARLGLSEDGCCACVRSFGIEPRFRS